MIKDQMDEIYSNIPLEEIPWNMETPPDLLKKIIDTHLDKSSKIIELGCGAGNYVIYFAGKGLDITGVDISSKAIDIAKNSAKENGVSCNLFVCDALNDMTELSDNYDFVYDWELLHHIFPEDREKYINNVCRLLKPGGLYLSVSFSELSPQFGGKGIYRKTPLDTVLYFSSESEISELVKPHFKVLELKTVEIPGKHAPHKAIYTLLKKQE
ncbi:MAG: class I SAM-dependent methyltransferase [Ignavibacterium sp.]|nr:MAG: class I SAM-dependent methyltransferase [Ignavibacterium sp.]